MTVQHIWKQTAHVQHARMQLWSFDFILDGRVFSRLVSQCSLRELLDAILL